MALFASSLRLSFVAMGAIVAVLPLCSGACGRTACFEFSASQYAANNGCPAQANALQNFTSPQCPGSVVSVDSDGSFVDGELCCYSVTMADINRIGSGGSCVGFGGAGGAGAFGGSAGTSAFGGSTTFVATSSGFGGTAVGGAPPVTVSSSSSTGMPSCVSCLAEFNSFGNDPSQLCSSAAPAWDALTTCMCNGGPCSMACTASFCAGQAPDDTCTPCLSDPSTNGCGMEVMECQSN
jgi:hypothetical protein